MIITSLAALAVLAGGCELPTAYRADPAVDAWAVTSANDQAVRDALIRQSTMYPYHFVTNDAGLNDLGASDLTALMAHFRSYPGRLSIRRGGEPEALYNARVAGVLAALAAGGVDKDRITVVDLPADGDGMPSNDVIVIMKLPVPVALDTDI
jgi:hypothetical protein